MCWCTERTASQAEPVGRGLSKSIFSLIRKAIAVAFKPQNIFLVVSSSMVLHMLAPKCPPSPGSPQEVLQSTATWLHPGVSVLCLFLSSLTLSPTSNAALLYLVAGHPPRGRVHVVSTSHTLEALCACVRMNPLAILSQSHLVQTANLSVPP